jgi:dTDP-4-dehydrorhamnose 3,5-epimerase
MSNFDFIRMSLPEVILVKPRVFRDDRGYFFETYKKSDFAAGGIAEDFVQDNYSHSMRGVIRGLHYQKEPYAQGKLVRCAAGRILDVAVDIRRGSPSYGKWVAARLTDRNQCMLYIPPGFAHGFLALSETADVFYKCTTEYAPQCDRGIIWNDPDIAVAWPELNPVLSPKDAVHPCLRAADNNFIFNNNG